MTPDTTSIRMRYANLLAAARATLTAARDGETNPLAYLIDELATHGQLPPTETGLTAWHDPANNSADNGNQR